MLAGCPGPALADLVFAASQAKTFAGDLTSLGWVGQLETLVWHRHHHRARGVARAPAAKAVPPRSAAFPEDSVLGHWAPSPRAFCREAELDTQTPIRDLPWDWVARDSAAEKRCGEGEEH